MRKFLVPACMFLVLASCEQMQQHRETAQHALRVFCALNRIEIISSTLLTPEQQKAGAIVCAAVGMHLGQ